MDCHMPVMDGYTASKTIRNDSTNPNQSTPIIALTADVEDENEERCKAAGMNAFLCKPIRIQNVHTTLASIFDSVVIE
jgi:CheY-like chemotaxis protein